MADVVSKKKLARTVALSRRFSCPRIAGEVRWITNDATPGLIGAFGWGNRTYIRAPAAESTEAFAEDDGRPEIIADKELMCLAL